MNIIIDCDKSTDLTYLVSTTSEIQLTTPNVSNYSRKIPLLIIGLYLSDRILLCKSCIESFALKQVCKRCKLIGTLHLQHTGLFFLRSPFKWNYAVLQHIFRLSEEV